MTMKGYQFLALRTAKDDMSIIDVKLGLIGEFGEMIDCIKKIEFHKHSDLEKLKAELGDVLWYIVVYAHHYGIKLTDIKPASIKNMSSQIFYVHQYISDMLKTPDELTILPTKHMAVTGLHAVIRLVVNIAYKYKIVDYLEYNIDKLKKRYPDKYSDYYSINREV